VCVHVQTQWQVPVVVQSNTLHISQHALQAGANGLLVDWWVGIVV